MCLRIQIQIQISCCYGQPVITKDNHDGPAKFWDCPLPVTVIISQICLKLPIMYYHPLTEWLLGKPYDGPLKF